MLLGSNVLEFFAGLVFVYLLVALICTQVSDRISQAMNWRARDLYYGIRNFLLGESGDHPQVLTALYNTVEFKKFNRIFAPLTDRMLQIPLVKRAVFTRPLAANSPGSTKRDFAPVDIPPDVFAKALIRTLATDNARLRDIGKFKDAVDQMAPSPLRDVLLSFATKTHIKVDEVQAQIEDVFKLAEKQMTALYGQNMWWISLRIGFVVCLVFNLDTFAIGTGLWRDPALRTAVNAAATKYVDNPQPDQARKTLELLNLPIGWKVTGTDWQILGWTPPHIAPNDWVQNPRAFTPEGWLRDLLIKLVGWVITAVAGAQGAPAWFDLLRRFTKREAT